MAENTVKFRDQEVTLKYPLYSLIKLEEQGVKLADLETDQVEISQLIKIVWAGLICNFKDATVDEVALSYDISDMGQLSEAMSAAFNKVQGK